MGQKQIRIEHRKLELQGATWVSRSTDFDWIEPRLAEFGSSVSSLVPSGYEAYAIVPYQVNSDEQDLEVMTQLLRALPGVPLAKYFFAIWEGYGNFWVKGLQAPRVKLAAVTTPDEPKPSNEDINSIEAVYQIDYLAPPISGPVLHLPNRDFYVWSGLKAAVAATSVGGSDVTPDKIWPSDRAWFIGTDVDLIEIAVGGSEQVVTNLLQDPVMRSYGARRAVADEYLKGD